VPITLPDCPGQAVTELCAPIIDRAVWPAPIVIDVLRSPPTTVPTLVLGGRLGRLLSGCCGADTPAAKGPLR
jgi:hypothetical protein